MTPAVGRFFLIALASAATFGQTFEVASVKPATPDKSMPTTLMRLSGGPGTPDPGQLTYDNVPLRFILVRALEVQNFQLSGPNWLWDQRYDIHAKIAPGTTKAQFNLMLQNLFAERLGMKIHREKRELPGYELVVGKGGLKMRQSGEPVGPPALPGEVVFTDGGGGRIATTKDRNGLTELAPGRKGLMLFPLGTGRLRLSARLQSLAEIISACQSQTGQPVIDKTGLTGTYDFNVDFSRGGQPASVAGSDSPTPLADAKDDAGLPFQIAIQSLGLRLQPAKLSVEIVVIDHIEKIPTAN